METSRASIVQRVFFPGGWGTPRDRRNWLRLMGLCCAFALSWAMVTYVISAGHLAAGLPALVVTTLPALLCLGAMAAYTRFLRETDELQRRVQIDGLALGFGAGVFWSVLGSMLARAGAAMPDNLGVLPIMLCAYSVGVSVAAYRHGAWA